jgi:group I intron endonuclease
MWFNKATGRVYIGSAIDGPKRLATYYQPSVLKKKSLIYQSILKYGHQSFSVIILEVCGVTKDVTKEFLLSREKFYLDWALKTYGVAILNMLNQPGSSLGYKHTEDSLKLMSEIKKRKT